MPRRSAIRCVPALLLAGLLLVACAAPRLATTNAQSNTIVFGTTLPITGDKAEEGRYSRDGYLLYINTINQRGGITVGGKTYKVKLLYYDDESKPERIAPLYEKLVTQDRVNLLLGPYSSLLTASATSIPEKYRVPMLAAHSSAESIFERGNRYSFSIISPARSYLRGVIDVVLAKDPTIKTLALLGSDEPFAQEVLDGAAEYAAARGLTVVYQQLYPVNPPDLSPLLQTIKAKNPDILLAAGHLQDALLIVKQSKALGISPKALGFTSGPSTPEFRANLKADADYIFGATQWTDEVNYSGIGPWATPPDYVRAFQAAYPEYTEIPYQAAESTAGLVAFQQALEQAGSLDAEAVRNALSKLDVMTFYGPIKFDARGVNLSKPMVVEQLQPDGKKYTVFPPDVAEKAALYPMPPWSKRAGAAP